MTLLLRNHIANLSALVDRLRPASPTDAHAATLRIQQEAARLLAQPEEALVLRQSLHALLAQPHQTAFYAETGIRSALGFWLELTQRLGHKVLPPVSNSGRLRDSMAEVFHHNEDHLWVNAASDDAWIALAEALGLESIDPADGKKITSGVLDAVRVLSYRLAGVALDRELLHAESALEEHESPFLAQNAVLIPMLERIFNGGTALDKEEVQDIEVLLEQCDRTLDRVRRRARENGISIRLTYQLARMRQLIKRMRMLLDLIVADHTLPLAIQLLRTLLNAEKSRHSIWPFMTDNLALLARNVTDRASRHGEHYIASDRAEWWAMARGAAGGGVVIALMALLKLRLAMLHLPPLTEAIAYSLNYSIGFVLIHLLGLTVATKQPAMTAASIAATVEESKPRELDKLCGLVQNLIRTQFIAVVGNVGLALPIACLIAVLWPLMFGSAEAPPEKIASLLRDIHPTQSAALLFAAVAGVGLFLSGLVSGFFDNKARYHQIAERIAHAPVLLRLLGHERSARLGQYLDMHLGAILGNLFFGFYLGMAGAVSVLTGLPIDIRHVAFASANLGTAVTTLGFDATRDILPWAIAGVIGIAMINLFVSFSLALFVAMKSRRLGAEQMLSLGRSVLQRFIRKPLSFITPPPAKTESETRQ